MGQSEVLWLEGRCVSIGESIGYWVFIDILRSYLEFAESDSPETLVEKIVEKMKSLFPQRWEEIVPYISHLLSVKFGNQWDEKVKYLPAEQVKYQTFLTLRDVFQALANQKPTLLILEDLHWADNLSLDLLSLLMNDLTLAPLMLLCVYRPEKEHKVWHIGAQASAKCLDRYKEITLRALNPQESRRLVESLLWIDNLPEAVKASILQKAEGNPFFVEEVLRSLIDSGVVYRDGERWVAKADVEKTAVPDTIPSVIMARIDQLDDEVKYVVQSAAVIGRLFRHKLLGYITQLERNLDGYLWQLEERDLVYEERAIPEVEYSFRHALTQETAYNTILSRRRREFHRQVGEGYEALYASRIEEYYEELAYHYSRSDDKGKALHYLVKAGDKSKEAFANEAAIAYYHQALKLMDEVRAEPALRGHIYQNLGEIYFPLTKHEEALESCRKALEYTADKKRRARIYGTMGWIYERYGKYDLALEHLHTGIAELGDDIESPGRAMISIPLSWVHIHKGNIEEGEENVRYGLKIVEGTEHDFERVELYICLNWIYATARHDIDKAFEYAQKGVQAAQKSGNSYLIAHSTFWLGNAHWQKGEADIAIKRYREAIATYKKIGHNFGMGQTYASLSQVYQKRDDWPGVIECLERCLEIPGYPWHMDHILRLAWAYLQSGDAEKAIKCCKKALEGGMSNNTLVEPLGVMEEAFAKAGKRGEFIPYCKKLKEEKKGALQDLKLTQWYLEPKELSGLFTQTVFADKFDFSNRKI
ncbi:tetratricopeptide repeat protein [Candidatus Poribacteria bacterium]|nr:tetratricopeptide repeat protein [Candidatus Poribacteria bacterium]